MLHRRNQIKEEEELWEDADTVSALTVKYPKIPKPASDAVVQLPSWFQ